MSYESVVYADFLRCSNRRDYILVQPYRMQSVCLPTFKDNVNTGRRDSTYMCWFRKVFEWPSFHNANLYGQRKSRCFENCGPGVHKPEPGYWM